VLRVTLALRSLARRMRLRLRQHPRIRRSGIGVGAGLENCRLHKSCEMIELVTNTAAIDFRSLRFLVVDDDRDQRYLLTKTLAGMGTARVVEAVSGHDALALLDRGGNAVDILVTDLQMPGMDGLELLRRVGERKLP